MDFFTAICRISLMILGIWQQLAPSISVYGVQQKPPSGLHHRISQQLAGTFSEKELLRKVVPAAAQLLAIDEICANGFIPFVEEIVLWRSTQSRKWFFGCLSCHWCKPVWLHFNRLLSDMIRTELKQLKPMTPIWEDVNRANFFVSILRAWIFTSLSNWTTFFEQSFESKMIDGRYPEADRFWSEYTQKNDRNVFISWPPDRLRKCGSEEVFWW
jgi:hypothetical protein